MKTERKNQSNNISPLTSETLAISHLSIAEFEESQRWVRVKFGGEALIALGLWCSAEPIDCPFIVSPGMMSEWIYWNPLTTRLVVPIKALPLPIGQ